MNILIEYVKSIFFMKRCQVCNKNKRKIMNIPIYCDILTLEEEHNTTLDYMDCCKNCIYELHKKEMIMISYRMCIKNTIIENITKDDLSLNSKNNLSKMQDIIIEENKYIRCLYDFTHPATIITPV